MFKVILSASFFLVVSLLNGVHSDSKSIASLQQISALPAGSYSVTVTRHDAHNDYNSEDYAGEWVLNLNRSEEFTLTQSNLLKASGKYSLAADQLTFESNNSTGKFKWTFDGQQLTLNPLATNNFALDFALTLRPLNYLPEISISRSANHRNALAA
ncbi:hypothetical protein OZ401_005035 (plasmid) [Candidatus Chlorohelix allophototropha]|uniref:Uncharacterized protein n=1 Tax=Candidatus Chlorohelix allophototropha TaxID=3003348 RepID=A0ABY9BAT6_9CHLR|nr:hypothetical protein OZ401_005035 [Chloroflexota bacterium L227-S17]